ncbi:DUF3099 family protein [Haloactinospora alba]|uniref:DUF3099 family protein n=1 Tax=Haloactinospora alba TaxID=405555 RepID=A0A543NJ34_9ACTN|nr:DUF3099 domain-containing protein [Haloactinospora alba]TQN31760.1 DUF3099 family protein [Haloactinospora alba]
MERRKRRYTAIMVTCLVLFAGSFPVYHLWGVWGAAGMCAVAMLLPPVAAAIGNIADPSDPGDHAARYGPNADRPGEKPPEG